MNIEHFPPIELIKASEQPGQEFSSRKKMFMNLRVKDADKFTAKTYIDTFLGQNFMNPYVKHPYMELDRVFFQNIDIITEATGVSREELFSNNGERLRTEIKDLYLAPVMIEEWSKSKQVYKPDPDFAAALLKTQKLQITKDMLTHLPYEYFYIDLSDIRAFDPITGIFVFVDHITENDKNIGVNITIYILTDSMMYFSHYFNGYYSDKGIIDVDMKDEEDAGYEVWNADKEVVFNPEDFNVERNQVSLFVLQLISYLSIEEPQITESDYTKGTYKKRNSSQKIKNKWNEVQIFDVGVRYGTNYRKNIERFKKQNEETKDTDVKHHKSPIPHMRSAHWHKYWVGEGRTQLKVNWIEPTFVGAKETKDVIIHEVS